MLPLNQILQHNITEGIPLPDKCVQCIVTSPPYWGLRDYGIAGQLGLEKTPEAYIEKMVAVFRECRRVLRDDGTLWLNIGDSYAGSGKGMNGNGDHNPKSGVKQKSHFGTHASGLPICDTFKPKDLIGIPWMLAFALRADGWYLRSDIIWHKPNPMPESVTDRPTKAHEYIFLLTKSKHYYYDAEAIKEPSLQPEDDRGARGNRKRFPTNKIAGIRDSGIYPMANKRTVWTIPTQAFPEAHFATFPEQLPYLCIRAGTSDHGSCPSCAAPYERMIEKTGGSIGHGSWTKHDGNDTTMGMSRHNTTPAKQLMRGGEINGYQIKHLGWQPTCACPPSDKLIPSVVLDPFFGAGTTGIVARALSRSFIGIEINPAYIKIAHKRLKQEFGMFAPEVTAPVIASKAKQSQPIK